MFNTDTCYNAIIPMVLHVDMSYKVRQTDVQCLVFTISLNFCSVPIDLLISVSLWSGSSDSEFLV